MFFKKFFFNLKSNKPDIESVPFDQKYITEDLSYEKLYEKYSQDFTNNPDMLKQICPLFGDSEDG